MGSLYSQQMQFEQAIPYFDEALRLRPGDQFLRMFLNVARGRQQVAANLPQLLRKLSEEPKNVRLHLDAAHALAFANRQDEAFKIIDDLYALDPKDPQIYVLVGVMFSELGLNELSLDAHKRSLVKADNPAAHFNLAIAFEAAGKLDLALEHFAKVVQAKPDAGHIMKSYADALAKSGKRREALDMYKRSLSIVPTFAPSLFQAAILSDKLGDRTSATQYLATLKSVDPSLAKNLERYLKLRLWG
jgi:tetratricopeptide (TPR) repeat protein